MPNLKSIVESLLFVADAPVTFDRLCTLLEEFDRGEVKEALNALQDEYGREGRGVVLAEVATGFQFRTPAENADYLRRLTKTRPVKFSQSALETLAIIAYRQPVTRAEIEYLRGVDSGGVLKTILEKKLIKILGKKDIPGKPLIYGTTREFLELFSLKDLRSLPTLKEIRDLSETAPYEQQEELPLGQSEGEGDQL
ncbi:Segregation and condensation protein B [Geobacteraceae bacterium]|nr:Segregation and condensation protein B [Geobacteraceae bacterium]